MNISCKWCNSNVLDESAPSQGICGSCSGILTSEKPEALTDFVDSLNEPVVLLNPELRVIHINPKAEGLAQKENSTATGHLPGEVFECAYSSLPKGCGNTIHCGGCAMRRAVEATQKTGVAQIGIPAKVHQSAKDISLHVSVWMNNAVIMVLIDGLGENTPPQKCNSNTLLS